MYSAVFYLCNSFITAWCRRFNPYLESLSLKILKLILEQCAFLREWLDQRPPEKLSIRNYSLILYLNYGNIVIATMCLFATSVGIHVDILQPKFFSSMMALSSSENPPWYSLKKGCHGLKLIKMNFPRKLYVFWMFPLVEKHSSSLVKMWIKNVDRKCGS